MIEGKVYCCRVEGGYIGFVDLGFVVWGEGRGE